MLRRENKKAWRGPASCRRAVTFEIGIAIAIGIGIEALAKKSDRDCDFESTDNCRTAKT